MFLRSIYMKALAVFVAVAFASDAMAAELALPVPGTPVNVSQAVTPSTVKGLVVNPDNPLSLNFVLDSGESSAVSRADVKTFAEYFLAALSVPTEDIWVNLSPYEQDRVMEDSLAQTALGKVFLEKDYILKQLSATLTDPEQELGKVYWKALNAAGISASEAFTKIWISPATVEVSTRGNAVYIVNLPLKVQTEDDYAAGAAGSTTKTQSPAAEIVKTSILPLIEKEVNTGDNFKQLRQVMSAIVLAVWFKSKVKGGVFDGYIGKKNVKGIDVTDPALRAQVFNMYVQAFQKGVYDKNVKETADNGRKVKRHYFSGGVSGTPDAIRVNSSSVNLDSGRTSVATIELKTAASSIFTLSEKNTKRLDNVEKFFRLKYRRILPPVFLSIALVSALAGVKGYNMYLESQGIDPAAQQARMAYVVQKGGNENIVREFVHNFMKLKGNPEAQKDLLNGLTSGMSTPEYYAALVGLLPYAQNDPSTKAEIVRILQRMTLQNPTMATPFANLEGLDSALVKDLKSLYTEIGLDPAALAARETKLLEEYRNADFGKLDSLVKEQADYGIEDSGNPVSVTALAAAKFSRAFENTADPSSVALDNGLLPTHQAYKQIIFGFNKKIDSLWSGYQDAANKAPKDTVKESKPVKKGQAVKKVAADTATTVAKAAYNRAYRLNAQYRLGNGFGSYSPDAANAVNERDKFSPAHAVAFSAYNDLVGRFSDTAERANAINNLISMANADLSGTSGRAGSFGTNAARVLLLAYDLESDSTLVGVLGEFVTKTYQGKLIGAAREDIFVNDADELRRSVKDPVDLGEALKRHNQQQYFKVVPKPGKAGPAREAEPTIDRVGSAITISPEQVARYGEFASVRIGNEQLISRFLTNAASIENLDPTLIERIGIAAAIGLSIGNVPTIERRIALDTLIALAAKDVGARGKMVDSLEQLNVSLQNVELADTIVALKAVTATASVTVNPNNNGMMISAAETIGDMLNDIPDAALRDNVRTVLLAPAAQTAGTKPTDGGISASSITFSGTDTIKMKSVDIDFSKGLVPVVTSMGAMPAAVKTFDDLVNSLV